MDDMQPVLPKSFLQRFAKQIAFGVFCSCIATMIVQFAHIKQAVLYACSAATFIGGDPLKGEKGLFKKGEDKLKDIEGKIAGKIPKVDHMPTHLPSLHKTPEQLEAEARLKEEKEKRQNESKRKVVVARLESLGVHFDSEASLEKLQVELAEAEEMQRKRPLLDHADRIGLHVDPKEPYDVLAKRIKEAELDADYQEQVREYERNMAFRQQIIDTYNGRCPNPKCHKACRVTQKTGNVRCQKCGLMAPAGRFKGNWTMPPMPPPPKRKTGVMDRVKSLFGR